MAPKVKPILKQYVQDTSCKYKFGAHVAMAGGISKSVLNAHRLGANSFALFLKSPRRWESPAITCEEADKFKALCLEHGYNPLTDILPHGSYFINLGNPDAEKEQKAYGLFLDDLKRCEQLGIGLYNFHPGLSVDSDHGESLERLARNINRAILETLFVKIVLENMAGHGNLIGLRLEDLLTVIGMVEQKHRVGVCIDTCHTFAAGYDIRDVKTFDAFWAQFDAVIGAEYLSAIHLNDSKAPLGANRDLHQNLGRGFLGLEVFRLVSNSKRLEGIPIVLETPEGKDEDIYGEEIKLLEWLVGKKEDDKEYQERKDELWAKGTAERQEHLKKFETKKIKKVKKESKVDEANGILNQLKTKKQGKSAEIKLEFNDQDTMKSVREEVERPRKKVKN